jgi:hypothetical protein
MKKRNRILVSVAKPAFYLVGLGLSILLILWIETVRPSDFGFYKDIFRREEVIAKRPAYPMRATGVPLSEDEMEMARIAWTYFENNYNRNTGFVNSVDKYHATTFWDLSSSLMATLSAFEIGVIDSATMHRRIDRFLTSMDGLALYDNKLPNKVYNTADLQMTTYDNRPTPNGVGWSSMDIGRFLTFCTRLIHSYPAYAPRVHTLLHRWDIPAAIDDASLMGIGLSFKDGTEKKVQEGKLGYEEYAAKGFMMLGFDVSNAISYTDFIKFVKVNKEEIAVDSREVKYHPAYNYIVSDTYILDGIEYGFDINSRELGYRVFLAQKQQHELTKRPTAVGESHIDTVPYFIYNSVYVNGQVWKCVSESGEDADRFKTFSTSAAIGWYYLFDDPYGDVLMREVRQLFDPALGWFAGRYEADGRVNRAATANVNAMVLECLNYRANGPLVMRRIRKRA